MVDRYCLPLAMAVIGILLIVFIATTGGLAASETTDNEEKVPVIAVEHSELNDVVHEQRVKFAAEHGVADPASLVAAVKQSPMANLLISIAIEESLGDPVAVGSAGEEGAWQVKASDWGSVPRDMPGQADQAERIFRGLLQEAKGNKKKALAHYNGGTSPPGKSYRYAERILKRAKHLQIEVMLQTA